MSYSIKELLQVKLSKSVLMGKCFSCEKPVLDTENYQKVPGGLIHDDCYYDDIAEMLATAPSPKNYVSR